MEFYVLSFSKLYNSKNKIGNNIQCNNRKKFHLIEKFNEYYFYSMFSNSSKLHEVNVDRYISKHNHETTKCVIQ